MNPSEFPPRVSRLPRPRGCARRGGGVPRFAPRGAMLRAGWTRRGSEETRPQTRRSRCHSRSVRAGPSARAIARTSSARSPVGGWVDRIRNTGWSSPPARSAMRSKNRASPPAVDARGVEQLDRVPVRRPLRFPRMAAVDRDLGDGARHPERHVADEEADEHRDGGGAIDRLGNVIVGDVAHLVGEHPGDLLRRLGGPDEPVGEHHVSPREGEGVDEVRVDHGEAERGRRLQTRGDPARERLQGGDPVPEVAERG